MKSLAITNTATHLTATPFCHGFDAVVRNDSGGALVIQGSDDGVTYTDGPSVADKGYANVTLQNYMKVKTSGTLVLLI